MKWYNYKEESINIERCFNIYLPPEKPVILFFIDTYNETKINYETKEERDIEFNKIKALMGIKDYTSCGC